jgi:hypothetical protein
VLEQARERKRRRERACMAAARLILKLARSALLALLRAPILAGR